MQLQQLRLKNTWKTTPQSTRNKKLKIVSLNSENPKRSRDQRSKKYIKIIISGGKRHDIAAPQMGWNYAVCLFNLNEVSFNSTVCPLCHSTVSNYSSSLTFSGRHILVTGRWKTSPNVLTRTDRTPPSSSVNTSTIRPIGNLLWTTLSSAKSIRSPIRAFRLDLTHFGLLWRVGTYSRIHL